jgi:hypothetical protein
MTLAVALRPRTGAQRRWTRGKLSTTRRWHCLSSVGDREEARTERGRATVLRRAAQIKRDLAQQYDPQREAASQPLHLVAAGSSRDNLATRRWSGDPLRG